ncbi:class I SAM-dependent methyltransferase [Kitasatospora sp. NPDC002227]|uniref:class I SAM-dependent methyltransferase n=1 Tax=Kitasatospora sp. NPDC002227 TaxID=3154773 RepID=UPI003318FA4D
MSSAERAEVVPARVFGEVAEVYDANRPGYADELVAEVLDYARLGGSSAVEFGAGTGKASTLFAARGVPLVCVEPDARMAEVLRRNTEGYGQVRVEVGGFEEWQPGGRSFGLLYAATAWHWFDPDRRWELVHERLRPGGAVALFWNPHGVLDEELFRRLGEIDRRHGVAGSPHGQLAHWYDGAPGTGSAADAENWPAAEAGRDGRFTDLRSHRFRRQVHYDTERYLGFLSSISTYRVLAPEAREAVMAETARLLDARGGGIDLLHVSDLFLARRR